MSPFHWSTRNRKIFPLHEWKTVSSVILKMAPKPNFHSWSGKYLVIRLHQWKELTESYFSISRLVCRSRTCRVLWCRSFSRALWVRNKSFSVAVVESWGQSDRTNRKLLGNSMNLKKFRFFRTRTGSQKALSKKLRLKTQVQFPVHL